MRIKSIISVAAFGFGIAAAMPAIAQQEGYGTNSLGQQTYMTLYATCHGESGTGDGPFTELLLDKVPDLTQLSANNDGEFPMLRVIHIIDGRTGLRGHGGPMPIYGELFSATDSGMNLIYGNEVEARGRMLSLAVFLESMQP